MVQGKENTVTEEEIKAKSDLIRAEFDMPDPKSDPVTMKLTEEDLYRSARICPYSWRGLSRYFSFCVRGWIVMRSTPFSQSISQKEKRDSSLHFSSPRRIFAESLL